ncbi:MAG: ATP-binding protein [Candidatus Lokiarchaeia archaeon]
MLSKHLVLAILSQIFLLFSLFVYIGSFFIPEQDIIELDPPSIYKSRKGSIEIGKVVKKKRKKHKFLLSLKDLERHMFVCGTTGSGKSNFLQYFLTNFKKRYDIPILLVEFKGEYIFLQDIIDDLLVIRPGENFSINIFNPEGSNPQIHAERIFDILKSGQFLDESSEFSPQMEKVLVDILTKVCSNPQHQSWKGFYDQCKIYLNTMQKQIPMLHQSLVSIQNRIRRFSLGPLKKIFATRYKLKITELFDKNILIDLSSIIRLGGEKEDALFFLNMVLKYLWDKNLTQGAYDFKGIKHITIIEDAQYFAPKDITYQTKLTTYLEDIALLQRGTGECLISITTRPQISDEILANCGVLIIFKNHMQRGFLCELLNLDEEDEDYVSILEEGQCIARVNSVKRPFLLSIPHIKRHWLKRGDINQKNKMILKKLKEQDKILTEKTGKSKEILENSEKITKKRDNNQKMKDMFKEAAEIKYSLDNSFGKDGDNKETFSIENYRLCLNCNTIVEKKAKNFPYCGFSSSN